MGWVSVGVELVWSWCGVELEYCGCVGWSAMVGWGEIGRGLSVVVGGECVVWGAWWVREYNPH